MSYAKGKLVNIPVPHRKRYNLYGSFKIRQVEPSFHLTAQVMGSVVMTRTVSRWEWLCVSRVCLSLGDHERPCSELPMMIVPRTDTGALDLKSKVLRVYRMARELAKLLL